MIEARTADFESVIDSLKNPAWGFGGFRCGQCGKPVELKDFRGVPKCCSRCWENTVEYARLKSWRTVGWPKTDGETPFTYLQPLGQYYLIEDRYELAQNLLLLLDILYPGAAYKTCVFNSSPSGFVYGFEIRITSFKLTVTYQPAAEPCQVCRSQKWGERDWDGSPDGKIRVGKCITAYLPDNTLYLNSMAHPDWMNQLADYIQARNSGKQGEGIQTYDGNGLHHLRQNNN